MLTGAPAGPAVEEVMKTHFYQITLTQLPGKKTKLEVNKLTSCEPAERINTQTGRQGLPHARRCYRRLSPSQPAGAALRAPAAKRRPLPGEIPHGARGKRRRARLRRAARRAAAAPPPSSGRAAAHAPVRSIWREIPLGARGAAEPRFPQPWACAPLRRSLRRRRDRRDRVVQRLR